MSPLCSEPSVASTQQKPSSTCKPCPISVSLSSPHLSPAPPWLTPHSSSWGTAHLRAFAQAVPATWSACPWVPPRTVPSPPSAVPDSVLSCIEPLPQSPQNLCPALFFSKLLSHALTKHNLLISDLSRCLLVLYTRMSALPAADFRHTVGNSKCLLNE